MSARLTSVAIAQLLRQTSTTCVLINSQVSRASEEALKLLHADVDGPVPPNFLSALKFEDLLFPNVTLRQTKIPPRYTAWVREDLDAVIMHSSGTTGLPKPIYHSQTHPLIYAAAHRLPEQRDPFCFNVSTLPLYHVSLIKTSARSNLIFYLPRDLVYWRQHYLCRLACLSPCHQRLWSQLESLY